MIVTLTNTVSITGTNTRFLCRKVQVLDLECHLNVFYFENINLGFKVLQVASNADA